MKMENTKNIDLIVYSDGGARGNPGNAAYGFVIYNKDNEVVFKEGRTIGITTNNVAEYQGVINALKWMYNNWNKQEFKAQIYLDSLLVVSQLNGLYKVKHEGLRNLFFTVKELEGKLKAKITYSAIPREQNKEADKLVNLALDGKI